MVSYYVMNADFEVWRPTIVNEEALLFFPLPPNIAEFMFSTCKTRCSHKICSESLQVTKVAKQAVSSDMISSDVCC